MKENTDEDDEMKDLESNDDWSSWCNNLVIRRLMDVSTIRQELLEMEEEDEDDATDPATDVQRECIMLAIILFCLKICSIYY